MLLKVISILCIVLNTISISHAAELIPSCKATQGGMATATPDGKIYYCAQRMANIEWKYPGAVDYFILHEYGHIVLQSGNEMQVDCWTAHQFALMNTKESIKSFESALKFIRTFKYPDPKYGGTGEERALLIEKCYSGLIEPTRFIDSN